jgi:copper chaperone
MQKQFIVTGMTCEHCENRVAREVRDVPGITSAVADAAAGTLVVTGGDVLDEAAIADAVDEAGYALVHD